jgi:O-6-methylguanine DNA methyltransferase
MVELVSESDGVWQVSGIATPVGLLRILYAEPATVIAAVFAAEAEPLWFGRRATPAPAPAWLRALVEEALTTTLNRPWRLLDPGLTPLEARALARAVTVPFGTLTSYGALARMIGAPGRARAVGRAMSRSPAALLIPTHRVVRADGRPAPPERGGMAARLRAYEWERSSRHIPCREEDPR